MAKKTLPAKSINISDWYTSVIQQAKIADYSPVKGCMVMRPGAYRIWETVQAALNQEFAAMGIENCYFPMFIPMSFLHKEAKHVEGFAPELAVVTHGGGKKLTEELAVRPTSETIMYDMYSKWVSSWRDLPILLNQWNNVVRWEKRTYFFLRTTEFLWQEAHTAHATHEESREMVLKALACYQRLAENILAVPVIRGYKSAKERFAGGDETTTIEAMMPDGKALQAGTSHDLGQNFSKKEAFNIAFQNKEGKTNYAWQTSFGLATRMIGALILTHGDDDGLVLPPLVARYQVEIILPKAKPEILAFSEKLVKDLQDQQIRTHLNADESNSLGYRLNEAELQGTPIIIVVGDKELAAGKLTLKIRHDHSTLELSPDQLASKLPQIFTQIQATMLDKARQRVESQTQEAKTYDDFKRIMASERGFIKAHWCENPACEEAIKQETKATTRCLPLINEQGKVATSKGKCIYCGQPAIHEWLFAQAY